MKKILLTLFICLLIVAVGAGIWGYKYFFGVDDQLRAQLQEEFSQDFFSFNDLESELLENNIGNSNNNIQAANGANKEEIISNKYNEKFEMLESSAAKKVDVLFQSAYKEYLQQTSENQLNQTQLARKYLQAGNMLEESIDTIFNDLIREMEKELKANNLSIDLVREVEEDYNQMIKQKKAVIMQQLEGHL